MGMDAGAVVVAIGAGAGGAAALAAAVDAAAGAGAAVVVVEASPESPRPAARLPIVEITDGMSVEAGRIHLAPPALDLRLDGDRFVTTPPPGTGPRAPIDRTLRALAGPRCLGILVGDPGSDGLYGLAA